jgi:hypothetical protein
VVGGGRRCRGATRLAGIVVAAALAGAIVSAVAVGEVPRSRPGTILAKRKPPGNVLVVLRVPRDVKRPVPLGVEAYLPHARFPCETLRTDSDRGGLLQMLPEGIVRVRVADPHGRTLAWDSVRVKAGHRRRLVFRLRIAGPRD